MPHSLWEKNYKVVHSRGYTACISSKIAVQLYGDQCEVIIPAVSLVEAVIEPWSYPSSQLFPQSTHPSKWLTLISAPQPQGLWLPLFYDIHVGSVSPILGLGHK